MSTAESIPDVYCRPFERRWKNFIVDRNLKDEWLERLNSLRSFDLISICEWHPEDPDHPYRRLPHINLGLKDGLIETLFASWMMDRSKIESALGSTASPIDIQPPS